MKVGFSDLSHSSYHVIPHIQKQLMDHVGAGFPTLATYDAMAHRAHELMADEHMLNDYRGMAREKAPKFSDRKGLLNKIMNAFEDFAKRQEQP